MGLKLKWKSIEPGFCRIYYTAKVNNKTLLYCLQDNGKCSEEQWVFYGCSSEGEPDFVIPLVAIESIDIPHCNAGIVLDLLSDKPFEHLIVSNQRRKVKKDKYACEYCKDTGEIATPNGFGLCLCRLES